MCQFVMTASAIKQIIEKTSNQKVHVFVGRDSDSFPDRETATFCKINTSCHDGMILASLFRFVTDLKEKVESCNLNGSRRLVLLYSGDLAEFQQLCFMLGGYMILVQSKHSNEIRSLFSRLCPNIDFCIPDGNKNQFGFEKTQRVTVRDCWASLECALEKRLINLPSDKYYPSLLLDNHEGQVNIIVPSKLVMVQLCAEHSSTESGLEFLKDSRLGCLPTRLADRLSSLGVTSIALLRKSEADSGAEHFVAPGLRARAISFAGGTTPPPLAVSFLFRRVVDGARGPVAIVCDGGPAGGVETLAALYLMRMHGFSAAAAAAWVRMAGPGQPLSAQQSQYLAALEALMRERAAQRGRAWPAAGLRDDGEAEEGCPAAGRLRSLAECWSMVQGAGDGEPQDEPEGGGILHGPSPGPNIEGGGRDGGGRPGRSPPQPPLPPYPRESNERLLSTAGDPRTPPRPRADSDGSTRTRTDPESIPVGSGNRKGSPGGGEDPDASLAPAPPPRAPGGRRLSLQGGALGAERAASPPRRRRVSLTGESEGSYAPLVTSMLAIDAQAGSGRPAAGGGGGDRPPVAGPGREPGESESPRGLPAAAMPTRRTGGPGRGSPAVVSPPSVSVGPRPRRPSAHTIVLDSDDEEGS